MCPKSMPAAVSSRGSQLGSTTACVGSVTADGNINIVNVGDSGFTYLQREGVNSSTFHDVNADKWKVASRSVPRDHGPKYNGAPFQMGDGSSDVVGVADSLHALARMDSAFMESWLLCFSRPLETLTTSPVFQETCTCLQVTVCTTTSRRT